MVAHQPQIAAHIVEDLPEPTLAVAARVQHGDPLGTPHRLAPAADSRAGTGDTACRASHSGTRVGSNGAPSLAAVLRVVNKTLDISWVSAQSFGTFLIVRPSRSGVCPWIWPLDSISMHLVTGQEVSYAKVPDPSVIHGGGRQGPHERRRFSAACGGGGRAEGGRRKT